MSRVVQYSFSGYPAAYEQSISYNAGTSPNNALTDTTSSTYARFTATSSSVRKWYYSFNLSSIPENSVITNVTFKGKVTAPNKTGVYLSLANLTTARGSSTETVKKTATITSLTNGGSWSASELPNLRLQYAASGSSNTCYFYGLDLYIDYTITYYSISTTSSTQTATITSSTGETESGGSATITVTASNLSSVIIKDNGVDVTNNFTGSNGTFSYTLNNINSDHSFNVEDVPVSAETMKMKQGGSWVNVSKAYKKISNIWVEQTDLTTVFSYGNIYINNL